MEFVKYDTQSITAFVDDYAKKLGFVENDEEQQKEMQLNYKTKLEQIKSKLMKKIIEDLTKNESITIEKYWYWLEFETRIFTDANDIVESRLDIEKDWFTIKSKAERFYKEELKEQQRQKAEGLTAQIQEQVKLLEQQEQKARKKKVLTESIPLIIFIIIILFLLFAINYSINLFLGTIVFLIFAVPTVLGIVLFFKVFFL